MFARLLALLLVPAICLSAPHTQQRSGVNLHRPVYGPTENPIVAQAQLLYAALSSTPAPDSARGSGDWTFARNLEAYYVDANSTLSKAAVNNARFSPDGYGIQIEPASKNLLTYSEAMEHANWGNDASCTVYQHAADSPLVGVDTLADKIIETADDTDQILYMGYTGTANLIDILSVYAKADERTKMGIQWSDGAGDTVFQFYDIDAGTVLSASTTGSVTPGHTNIVALADDWYRVVLAVQTEAGTGRYITLGLATEDLKAVYNGDGSSGAFFYGAQVETGCATWYASSYIKTTSAAVTRPKDELRYTASAVVPGTRGTMVAEVTVPSPGRSGSQKGVVFAAGAWGGSSIHGLLAEGDFMRIVGGTMDTSATAGAIALDTPTQMVLTWSPSKIVGYVGGAQVLLDTSVAGAVNTALYVGGDSGTQQSGCWIREFRVYQSVIDQQDIP